MGNSQINSELVLYGKTEHPIQGQVTAFMVKNEAGKFIMKVNMRIDAQRLYLYERVESGKNTKLIAFYGIEESDKINVNNAGQKKGQGCLQSMQIKNQIIQIPMYWEYFNWDLQKQIKHLKQKQQFIKQQVLWQILQNCLLVCQYLSTLYIYPQFHPLTIQFTVGKQPKFYWCQLLPNNMHRGYERYINLGEFRHGVYSPQQLLEINRKVRSHLERQKCVVFNIGLILLEACTKCCVKELFNYQKRAFSEAKKREQLSTIQGRYSKQFEEILIKLLQFFPKDRLDYKQTKQKIYFHKNPIIIQVQQVTTNDGNTVQKNIQENIQVKSHQCWSHH